MEATSWIAETLEKVSVSSKTKTWLYVYTAFKYLCSASLLVFYAFNCVINCDYNSNCLVALVNRELTAKKS